MTRSTADSWNKMHAKSFFTLTRLECIQGRQRSVSQTQSPSMCKRRLGGSASGSESFISSDMYAPTLKAPEARLLSAITAKYGCPLLRIDVRQAFLYGEMDEDERLISARPIGGRNLFPTVIISSSHKHVWHEAGRPTMAC
jgi:hypothetical protein